PDRRSDQPEPADTGFLRPAGLPGHGHGPPPVRAATWLRARLPPWLRLPACVWLHPQHDAVLLPHACAPPRLPCAGPLPRRLSFSPLPRPVSGQPPPGAPPRPSAFRPVRPAVVPRLLSVPAPRAPPRQPLRAVRPDAAVQRRGRPPVPVAASAVPWPAPRPRVAEQPCAQPRRQYAARSAWRPGSGN